MNPRLSSILFGSIACLLAADKGSASGSSEKPPTLEEQLEQVTADLATARASLATLEPLTDAHTALQAQFDAATAAAQEARDALAALQTSLDAVTAERDTFRTEIAAKDQQLTLKDARLKNLETLCGIRGIDPNAAPAALPEDASGASVFAEYQRLRQTDTAKAQTYFREHKAELEAYGAAQNS